MYKNAIVRLPCRRIKFGLTSSDLGKPDYKKALDQHSKYVESLHFLGLDVKILPENDLFPDSTFIEDVALCTPEFAVITNPGAVSRRGEIDGVRQVLEEFYKNIEEIRDPGTLESGDVLKAGDLFIGISGRTNNEGADQLTGFLNKYGMTASKVELKKMLHLKSGVSFLENNIMLVSGEFTCKSEFAGFKRIKIVAEERYAANSLLINGKVLVPEGFPRTRKMIERAGHETIVLDVSEFRKVDGGLSCLSLRF